MAMVVEPILLVRLIKLKMIKKRKIIKKSPSMSYSNWEMYDNYQYKGIIGKLMKFDHEKLEEDIPKKKYNKVLEIGPGPHPHLQYIKHDFGKYYILEKEKEIIKHYKKFKNKKIIVRNYKSNKIPFKNKFFDRIIMSHTLEHINFPESFIFDAMSKLKKGGILSISLPTDPGLMWRIGRLFSKIFFIKDKRKISGDEYEYINAKDHVNTIFGLYHIINFNYKNKKIEKFLPFRIKLFDLNLFYNVHIIK